MMVDEEQQTHKKSGSDIRTEWV